MNYLKRLYEELERQCGLHADEIYNYAVPQSWNLYGYRPAKSIRSKELLVHPYEFYLFTLHHILKDADGNWKQPQKTAGKTSDRSWLKNASIYSLMVRTATAWDHDRDDRLVSDNLYHLNDNGTFLKSILLLPLLKRMGINTILLHQIFPLCKTQKAHDYPVKEAVTDFRKLDDTLKDNLISELCAEEQCAAFIEACHLLGFRVLLEYCPGKLARENSYYQEHPEWFFWYDADRQNAYHAPLCNALPQNTIPFSYALKDFYRSEDVQKHIALFQEAPAALASYKSLKDIEYALHTTIAPAMVDQINAGIPVEQDTTIWRFYEDFHAQTPKEIRKSAKPYLMQDVIRYDLHPARKPMSALWDMLCENITWYQQTLGIDGIYLEKPYLLPEKLQKALAKTARKQNRAFAMIAEDTAAENSPLWLHKGYDAISGSGAYEESDLWNFKFHSFSYRLKGNVCPMLAACEAHDSRRITSVEGNTGTIMLTVMNQFLPNGIPFMMNGVECFEVQPMQLSEYGDPKYLNILPKEDARHHKQAYLDEYWFNYRSSDLPVLPSLLEKTSAIRQNYLEAITNPDACIPVWFDSPRDYGIGFTYICEDRALLVVCNTNVHDSVQLHIHTENMICELPFAVRSIKQIFSTKDPYMHDFQMDSFQNIPLAFDPGEVKFIQLKPESL
ncbi:MAG: maltodextrin glycosyltransferase [Erysipelotrichaceae bacterium]|nr:maltodextrin glycosyltransferase [Erysipelotrichaceae bacterium]